MKSHRKKMGRLFSRHRGNWKIITKTWIVRTVMQVSYEMWDDCPNVFETFEDMWTDQ